MRKRLNCWAGLLFALGAAGAAGTEARAPAASRGLTWGSLSALPDFLDAEWVPENLPANEIELLKSLGDPPLRPELLPQARARVQKLIHGAAALPTAGCHAPGQPRLGWYPYPLRFIYGAGNVMIEVNYQVRQIPVRGLQHPEILQDTDALVTLQAEGDARGIWDGDALVIDTIAVRDDFELYYGVPSDPRLHVVERYRLLAPGRLERITFIEAPARLTRPWVVRTTYRRAPAGSYASRFCEPRPGGWFDEYRKAGPADVASPASASAEDQRTFTPHMTWASIQTLPRLWGRGWASPQEYDATQIVLASLKYPPLKPQVLRRSQARVARILQGKADFKQASCAPNGMTRVLWYTTAPVFFFQPGERLVLAQFGEFRQVWMDGRPHPAGLDPNEPSIKYNGHSIGWWQGDDLYIDTVGVHPGHELFYGAAYGPGMRVLEHYHLRDADHLELTARVEAPAVLQKPWVFSRSYFAGAAGQAGPGTPVAGDGGGAGSLGCTPTDSRQKVDADGNVFLDLTPPPRP